MADDTVTKTIELEVDGKPHKIQLSVPKSYDQKQIISAAQDYANKNPDKFKTPAEQSKPKKSSSPTMDKMQNFMENIPVLSKLLHVKDINAGFDRMSQDPYGGASDVLRSTGKAMLPMMAPEIIANPIGMAGRAVLGAGMGAAAEGGASLMGAPPGVQELAGTAGGMLPFGSPKIGTLGEETIRNLRPSMARFGRFGLPAGGGLGGALGAIPGLALGEKMGGWPGAVLGADLGSFLGSSIEGGLKSGIEASSKEPFFPKIMTSDDSQPPITRKPGAIKEFSATVKKPVSASSTPAPSKPAPKPAPKPTVNKPPANVSPYNPYVVNQPPTKPKVTSGKEMIQNVTKGKETAPQKGGPKKTAKSETPQTEENRFLLKGPEGFKVANELAQETGRPLKDIVDFMNKEGHDVQMPKVGRKSFGGAKKLEETAA